MIPILILAIENEDDKQFFTQLYMRFRRMMFAEALRFSSHGLEADDIVSEAIVRVISKVELIRSLSEKQRASYLVTTIYHVGCELYAKSKRTSVLSLDDDSQFIKQIQDETADTESIAIKSIEAANFRKVWSGIPYNEKYLLERKYILHHTDEEIAADLHIKPSSIRMKLTRAKRDVQKLLIAGNLMYDFLREKE